MSLFRKLANTTLISAAACGHKPNKAAAAPNNHAAHVCRDVLTMGVYNTVQESSTTEQYHVQAHAILSLSENDAWEQYKKEKQQASHGNGGGRINVVDIVEIDGKGDSSKSLSENEFKERFTRAKNFYSSNASGTAHYRHAASYLTSKIDGNVIGAWSECTKSFSSEPQLDAIVSWSNPSQLLVSLSWNPGYLARNHDGSGILKNIQIQDYPNIVIQDLGYGTDYASLSVLEGQKSITVKGRAGTHGTQSFGATADIPENPQSFENSIQNGIEICYSHSLINMGRTLAHDPSQLDEINSDKNYIFNKKTKAIRNNDLTQMRVYLPTGDTQQCNTYIQWR